MVRLKHIPPPEDALEDIKRKNMDIIADKLKNVSNVDSLLRNIVRCEM